MRQTKIETIIIFFILILYYTLSKLFFEQFGNIYIMIINPLFWIITAILLKLYFKKFYLIKKLKKEILNSTLITVLIYLILYLFFGLFVSFGKNPNSNTVLGFCINFWITGSVIICKEYIRHLIINNAYEKQKKHIAIALILFFTIFEINILTILNSNFYYIFQEIITKILPIISKNILFTYISYCKLFVPSILYELLIYSVLWMAPILPNLNLFMIAIIDITIPILLFVYIKYLKNSRELIINKGKKSEDSKPTPTIISIIAIIIGIWFTWGIFPIKPIAIASASMEPSISIGDIVIIKECDPNELKVGDVIEYNKNGNSIIHRIIEINYSGNKFSYFVAKGDNNDAIDKKVLKEQIVGKCLFKIKYLGYPSVWISNITKNLNN